MKLSDQQVEELREWAKHPRWKTTLELTVEQRICCDNPLHEKIVARAYINGTPGSDPFKEANVI